MNRTILLIAGAILLLLAGGAAWYFLNSGPVDDGVKLAKPQLALPLASNTCVTLAPDGWVTTPDDANGTQFTARSTDQSMLASYASRPVNGALAQGTNGQPGLPPKLYLQKLVSALTNAPVAIIADGRQYGGFLVMAIESGRYGGFVLYKVLPIKGDTAGYGLIVRVALGDKNSQASLAVAGSVAAAMRCKGFSLPQRMVRDIDSAPSHDTGTAGHCLNGSCDDSDLAVAFNAEIGTGWVHDDAGHNYIVDVVGDYSDNGPDGPGYYAMIRGTRQKLVPGVQ